MFMEEPSIDLSLMYYDVKEKMGLSTKGVKALYNSVAGGQAWQLGGQVPFYFICLRRPWLGKFQHGGKKNCLIG